MDDADIATKDWLREHAALQRAAVMPVPTAPSAKYGTDKRCGDPEERRQAVPGVLFCASCQARREFEKRQRGGR